jgi:predicted ATPase with chaperone activity
MVYTETRSTRSPVFQALSRGERPPAPTSVADVGLDVGLLADLTLKTLYFSGNVTAAELCSRMRLPMQVMTDVLTAVKRERLCETTGGIGISAASLNYSLTAAGLDRATSALNMSAYAGPAPLPLATYFDAVSAQSILNVELSRDAIEGSIAHLVLDPRTVEHIGQAISAKRAVLIYGASGNGKSSAADGLGRALPGDIYVPYAVEVMHQVIQVFDPSTHQEVEERVADEGGHMTGDARWVRIKRPVVMAAGELAASHLELLRDEVHKTYEAPIQMKANGGMLVIDDFGRQHLDAAYLLNRWIVPLEKGIDNLSLQNGARFQVPFDVIPLFITNRRPADLADEAFMRRIRYKVEVPAPDPAIFLQIFERECEKYGIDYDESAARYFVDEYFVKPGRHMRGCHPRDIIDSIASAARYRGETPALTPDGIDEACAQYFV